MYVSAQQCQNRWKFLVKDHPHLLKAAVNQQRQQQTNVGFIKKYEFKGF